MLFLCSGSSVTQGIVSGVEKAKEAAQNIQDAAGDAAGKVKDLTTG